MSKYSEIVALLEYMQKQTHRPQKAKKFFNPRKDTDIVALLKKKKEETELLEKFLKEQEKEKDPKKVRSFTALEWFVIGIMSYPLVGPLYRILTHNLEVFSTGVK